MSALLPKWPAIVVKGEKVSEELAAEIIVRCGNIAPFSNDREWERQVRRAFGFTYDDRHDEKIPWSEKSRQSDEIRQRLGILDLEYLEIDRIASSYIGGPHGWCDWDGTIETSGHNIGKWPSCESVCKEWQTIAEAWPSLKLRCQLFDREECEKGAIPVVQYDINNGIVDMHFDIVQPMEIVTRDITNEVQKLFATPPLMRERGCTIEKLKWAIKLVENKMKKIKTKTENNPKE